MRRRQRTTRQSGKGEGVEEEDDQEGAGAARDLFPRTKGIFCLSGVAEANKKQKKHVQTSLDVVLAV